MPIASPSKPPPAPPPTCPAAPVELELGLELELTAPLSPHELEVLVEIGPLVMIDAVLEVVPGAEGSDEVETTACLLVVSLEGIVDPDDLVIEEDTGPVEDEERDAVKE